MIVGSEEMAGKRLIILLLVLIMVVSGLSCHILYPTFDFTLGPGYEEATIAEVEQQLPEPLPLPRYLPDDYEIKQVYLHGREPQTSWMVHLLISDKPIVREGNQFHCKMVLTITSWIPGFKMPWAEHVHFDSHIGMLEKETDHNTLNWMLGSKGLSLHAIKKFSKEELVRIAESVEPETTPTPPPRPIPQQPTKPFLEIISVTSPIRPLANATLVAQVDGGAECSITIDYGPSGVQRLRPKIADTHGKVSWTWTVGNFRGTWEIVVKASYGGETAYRSVFFTVQ